ncbi:hypothetical protein DEU56DRAFT_919012 [Suillus clintonianus]|uniref:uncharacterized protein n=1 Tax=Suillus clintonianus TaxID=1904413 RepID=UPI001B870326|nr:uncharacterized protein DEU56DRAFT_919012 [Suillus clintonianus]KAG2117610.1 hypothetical protein DEU56DRAFT_919012 [Suillus clintonianus]
MSNSDSNSMTLSHSGSESGSESEDEGIRRPVAPPSRGASVEHYQEYIKYLQLQHGQLQQRNASLNESNNVLAAQQLKRSRKRPQLSSPRTSSMSQSASVTSSTPESAATSVTSDSSKTNEIDKLILGLAKKYALTTEMFLPDKVIFQTDCPDPPADFSAPNRYAKKSTEKDALVAELYASIDHVLHARMRTNMFFNQFGSGMQQARSSFLNSLRTVAGGIFDMPNEFFVSKYDRTSLPQVTGLIGWEAGKGNVYDIFKAPILYPDHIVNEKKIFRNWIVIAKVIKVAICGKMSLYPKARGGPPSYAKIWQLTNCTPGLIAFGVTSTIFILSPDQEFSGNGVGAISSIAYHSIFRTVKKFFVVKWTHQRIKSIIDQINGYVFDGFAKMQPSDDALCTMEDVTESLDRVMAALDASDSDSESLEYVDLPVHANEDTHRSAATSGPTSVAAMPTNANTLQLEVVAPVVNSNPDPQPTPCPPTPCLPTPTALHAETLATESQEQVPKSKGRKKTKSTNDSAATRRSSRHT